MSGIIPCFSLPFYALLVHTRQSYNNAVAVADEHSGGESRVFPIYSSGEINGMCPDLLITVQGQRKAEEGEGVKNGRCPYLFCDNKGKCCSCIKWSDGACLL